MQEQAELTSADMFVQYSDDPMRELDPWSPKKARLVAESLGITLTEEHWAVVMALREHYRTYGPSRARTLTSHLEALFSDGHGRRTLYELFPGGPVFQGSMIAGLPRPDGVLDMSFGSVQ